MSLRVKGAPDECSQGVEVSLLRPRQITSTRRKIVRNLFGDASRGLLLYLTFATAVRCSLIGCCVVDFRWPCTSVKKRSEHVNLSQSVPAQGRKNRTNASITAETRRGHLHSFLRGLQHRIVRDLFCDASRCSPLCFTMRPGPRSRGHPRTRHPTGSPLQSPPWSAALDCPQSSAKRTYNSHVAPLHRAKWPHTC